MNDRFLEQLINIKFCVKLGRNASDTCAVLSEAHGGGGMKGSSVSEWNQRFKEGHVYAEDEGNGQPRSHTASDNDDEVRTLVHSDRRLSIRAMAVEL
jgi:hypothetical protein